MTGNFSDRPLISVLIPTFNVEKFVKEAIWSIINQTYQNLEIIIVDDFSTDGTYAILKEIAESDSRIKLFRNPQNLKIVETLNFAITQATGQYYARMDGDDISNPSRIEEQLNFLKNNPKIDLIGLNVIMIDEEGHLIHKEKYPESHGKIVEASKYTSPIPHFWLAKKRVYEILGGYRIPTVEDYDFVLRCIDKNFVVHNLNSYLYEQRIRGGNTATSSGLTQYKLRKYVRKLAAERKLANGIDTYELETLNKYYSLSPVELHLYNASSSYHHKYIINKNKNMMLALIYMGMSLCLSPIKQTSQIIARYRYKRLKK